MFGRVQGVGGEGETIEECDEDAVAGGDPPTEEEGDEICCEDHSPDDGVTLEGQHSAGFDPAQITRMMRGRFGVGTPSEAVLTVSAMPWHGDGHFHVRMQAVASGYYPEDYTVQLPGAFVPRAFAPDGFHGAYVVAQAQGITKVFHYSIGDPAIPYDDSIVDVHADAIGVGPARDALHVDDPEVWGGEFLLEMGRNGIWRFDLQSGVAGVYLESSSIPAYERYRRLQSRVVGWAPEVVEVAGGGGVEWQSSPLPVPALEVSLHREPQQLSMLVDLGQSTPAWLDTDGDGFANRYVIYPGLE